MIKRDFFRNFDYILFGLVVILSGVGFLVLRSATATMNTGSSILKMQLISIILGLVVCIFLSLFDYTYFKPWGYFIYAGAIMLLIYVLFFGYGKDIPGIGSNSWIKIAGFTFQPAEIGKIAYVMVIPALLASIKDNFNIRKVFLIIPLAVLPLVLIYLQPEMGTTAVFAFALVAMVFVFGINIKWIGLGIAAVSAIIPLVYFFVLTEIQKTRILTTFRPNTVSSDASFQTKVAELAIGSGGLNGQGLFNGVQTQSSALPIKESDFIFSVIGEELGFIGCVLVIVLLVAIILRCIYIAVKSNDLYGNYISIGIAAMLSFHFIWNVGMNLGILPVSGIPLPFVSSGGTSMLIFYAMIGLVMSVSMRRKRE